MIEPRMLAYLEQNNKDALDDWSRLHMEWHQRIYGEAIKQGFKRFDAYPTLRDMEDLEGWLYFHNLEHSSMANSIGIGQLDLSEVDPDDEISWNSWLEAHSQIHSDLRSALGIIG